MATRARHYWVHHFPYGVLEVGTAQHPALWLKEVGGDLDGIGGFLHPLGGERDVAGL